MSLLFLWEYSQYKTKIDLTHPQDVKQLEKIIFDYLQKRLLLKVNNNAVALEFVGFEKDAFLNTFYHFLFSKEIRF